MTILLTLHIIVTIAMIGVILLQKSDGGASMLGVGSSSSMFSARGVANLFTRATSILAALFLTLCIAMAWLSNHNAKQSAKLIEGSDVTTAQTKTTTDASTDASKPAA